MTQPATIDATARDITPAQLPVEPKLPRLTKQQEAFVIAYMRYGVASKAYRLAYAVKDETAEKTVWSSASTVLNNRKVAAWVAHLRSQARNDNLNSVLGEFDQNRNGALEVGNFSAANGATRGKAQVLGLIPHNADGGGLPGGTTINILIVSQDEKVF